MLLRIKPSHPIVVDDKRNLSIGEIPGLARIVKDAPAWLLELLNLLDGTATLEEIYSTLLSRGHFISQEVFDQAIKEIRRASFLENIEESSKILTPQEQELYDRQMLYFSLVEQNEKPGSYYQEKLKQQHVFIFGVGGGGTWVSLNLALCGFGEITLVDGDNVEFSNLNRQVLYTNENLGMPKVKAAEEALKKINPNIKVNIINKFLRSDGASLEQLMLSLEKLISPNCTLIVLAWENLSYFQENTAEEAIHTLAHHLKIPVIEIGADPLSVSVGPLYVNDHHSTCFACVKSQTQQTYYSPDKTVQALQRARLKDGRQNYKPLNFYQHAPSLSIAGGLVVDQLIKFVTSCEAPLIIGKRYQLSLQSYEMNIEHLQCGPSCSQFLRKRSL
ncbi:MAG: ThiF family adenylyltransferase [Alphaproteobacteria bacterium]|nr:ThiF family adenylyltransferase [Alphaproteobacteria bacterium]